MGLTASQCLSSDLARNACWNDLWARLSSDMGRLAVVAVVIIAFIVGPLICTDHTLTVDLPMEKAAAAQSIDNAPAAGQPVIKSLADQGAPSKGAPRLCPGHCSGHSFSMDEPVIATGVTFFVRMSWPIFQDLGTLVSRPVSLERPPRI